MAYSSHRKGPLQRRSLKAELTRWTIADPGSAYFFLSDGAQDEITGNDNRRMKCLSCGYIFTGEICDRCPECFSPDTEDVVDK